MGQFTISHAAVRCGGGGVRREVGGGGGGGYFSTFFLDPPELGFLVGDFKEIIHPPSGCISSTTRKNGEHCEN